MIPNKRLLGYSSLILSTLLLAPWSVAGLPPSQKRIAATPPSTSPIIDLGYAQYEGVYDPSLSITHFLGIRYAASPTGSNRWRAPQPPPTSASVQKADAQPPMCMQGPAGGTLSTDPYRDDDDSDTTKRDVSDSQSEDCLFLNVYIPGSLNSSTPTESLPVLVWIHGGGFEFGAASSTEFPGASGGYDGRDLVQYANNGIVIVIIQYRLGVFGFLPGSSVKAAGSLNVGLLDQEFALRWVQDNISKFGGDPSRVTIWGQSAGASSVIYHITAHDGKTDPPLFDKAITSSTYLAPHYMYNDSISEDVYTNIVNQTNCSNATDTLQCLREADVGLLNAAGSDAARNDYFGTYLFFPVIDGTFLTQRPVLSFQEGKTNGAKVLSVVNADEGTLLVNPDFQTPLVDFVEYLFPTISEAAAVQAVDLYASDSTLSEPIDHAIAILGEGMLVCPTLFLLSAFNGRSYKGRFAIPPGHHFDDVYYYFNSLNSSVDLKYNNTAFDTAFAQSFISFAMSNDSDPNYKYVENMLPQWPLWETDGNASSTYMEMVFNKTDSDEPLIEAVQTSDILLERCRFWESIANETLL